MSGVNRLEKLEALRGAAAVYVVCHCAIPRDLEWLGLALGPLFSLGQEAVILFFLLSGFAITFAFNQTTDNSFQTTDNSFGRYLTRRFCTIYILLVAALLIAWILESLRSAALLNPEWINLSGNLLMLQDLGSAVPGALFIPYFANGPLGSLSYEWWSYLLFFPLVAIIKDTRRSPYYLYGITCLAALAFFYLPLH